jgi:hypothetical protein
MKSLTTATLRTHRFEHGSNLLNQQLSKEELITPELLEAIFTNPSYLQRFEMLLETQANLQPLLEEIKENQKEFEDRAKQRTELARNALAAFWEWMRDGFGIVPPLQLERRIKACQACPYYDKTPSERIYQLLSKPGSSSAVCRKCGCLLSKKLKLTSSKCPAENPLISGFSMWNEPFGV